MDGIDPDMICDVPDTPDRMAIRHQSDRSAKPCWQRGDGGEGVNQPPAHRDNRYSSEIYAPRCRDSKHRDDNSAAPNSPEYLFRQADLARSMPDLGESKSQFRLTVASNGNGESMRRVELSGKSSYPLSHPTRCRDLRRRAANPEHKERSSGSSRTSRLLERQCSGTGITLIPKSVGEEEKANKLDGDNLRLKSRDKGKGIDLCSNSQPKIGCPLPRTITEGNIGSEAGVQYPTNSNDLGTCLSSARSSEQNNGNGIDLCRNSESNMVHPRCLRSTGQRRLVRNGCISPVNIERGKSIVKVTRDKVENNGISSHDIHIISPDSGGIPAEKQKGKVTADDIVVSDDQHATEKLRRRRAGSLFGKEVTLNADKKGVTDTSKDEGWRTTRSHTRKPSILSFAGNTASISETEGPSNYPFIESHETAKRHGNSPSAIYDDHDGIALQYRSNIIAVDDSNELELQSGNMKGKRKFSLTRPRTGECSSSTSGHPKMLNLQQSRQALNLRSGRELRSQHAGIRLGPIIEVDDLQSPEVVCTSVSQHNSRASDHSIERASQVESDEILARQLQEELYNETPRTGGMEEIDATIAWSVLQEEDGHHASNRRQRDTSSSSARAGFHQSFTRATNRARRPMSNRMAQLRRELNRPVRGDMGLEMRLDFLEALELAFGDGNGTPRRHLIHHVQRDFNEDDYEMLLALDENNNHTGASESQINNLPQSVIQNVNSEETCAVCLEDPSVGDTIRHLPCLHKFHKECIDTWLRRRMSCPVCKSGIS